MNNTAVIYTSIYGSTKRYAQWIGQELSCPVIERKDFSLQDFPRYDTIIYGGGLYAGGVSGIKFITKNWSRLSAKQVVLFTCGLADPDDPDNISHIQNSLSQVLSEEMLTRIHLFHLRGSIDYPRLNFRHKCMMAMLRKMLLRKAPLDLREEDRLFLETYGKTIDFTSIESIRPLINVIVKSNPSLKE